MRPGEPLGPGDTVPLFLSEREHRLLQKELLVTSPELDGKLVAGMAAEGGVVLQLTLEDLEELAGCVAAAANHARNARLQRELDELYGRVEGLLDQYEAEDLEGQGPEIPFLRLPLDLGEMELGAEGPQAPGGRSSGQLRAMLEASWVTVHEPLAQLGGLAPMQLLWLCGNWEGPSAGVRLNEGLALEELHGAEHLHNTRYLLRAVLEEGKVKATVGGNLNRKFLESMFDRFIWPEGMIESLRRVSKTVNEADLGPLFIVRHLAGMGGLLRRAKGWFTVTKRGQKLLADSQAGALYALLFRTHFRKLNLACLDFLPECVLFQHTVGYSLLMVGRHAGDWITPTDLTPLVVDPGALHEVPPGPEGTWPVSLLRQRLLKPLESFGLLEGRIGPDDPRWTPAREVRKTPLFDAFLSFEVPPLEELEWPTFPLGVPIRREPPGGGEG